MKKIIISPSILSCDFMNIEKELRSFDDIQDIWLHLDIMDGHFVPNLTFGHPIVQKISQITDLKLDAHFMVTNPEFYIDTFQNYGIYNFTFHLEATSNIEHLITKAKNYYPSVGISIKPGTTQDMLNDELLKKLDLVLVMSVEPGFGGQKFIEDSYEKIAQISARRKALGLNFIIQVDGGINGDNAKKLAEAGADNLVAGSYIFKEATGEYAAKIDSLR